MLKQIKKKEDKCIFNFKAQRVFNTSWATPAVAENHQFTAFPVPEGE